MADVICQNCGKGDGFYQEVELTGHGWKSIEAKGNPDGSIEIKVDSYVQEIDWDRHDALDLNFECVHCGKGERDFLKLMKVSEEKIDPVAYIQKNPIPGQEALDV
jgi:hypothetical protein